MPSADLKVYVVWEPILLLDHEGAARRERSLIPDRRARHFWARDLEIGEQFQKPLGLTGEPAWDVYLLYPAGVRWAEGNAPIPVDFMHQLSGRLPETDLLDGSGLSRRVEKLVQSSPGDSTRN